MRVLLCLLLAFSSIAHSAPRHCRDCSKLPEKEQEFASKLSISKRKIFCGKFSPAQRQAAMRHADGVSPDRSVVKVMQETGMSLAVKSKKEVTKNLNERETDK